ncbi:HD-GYP domain-containing protein [Clostridium paraputrificum]|uniref:HD-GYP domain-containing protein n=1 Tax=Clostridium TaxID=1485 RepID=UPI003D356602
MRLIPIECVREESCLGKTINDNSGRVLLKEGTRLTESIIKKIQLLGIESIYIDDEYSNEEISEVIRPELREKSISAVKETFKSIDRIAKEQEKGPRSAIDKRNKEYFGSIYGVAEEILNNVFANNNMLFGLVDMKGMDNFTYGHSVNVAVISLIMGISLKMHKDDLTELCLGALSHDIGKIFIPKEITSKTSNLTEDESNLFKEHTEKGYEYLKENFKFKTRSMLVALQHHEQVDGRGYPYGITGESIHIYSKIVSIANCFDLLTSKIGNRKALSVADALEYIMAQAGRIFDFELVELFSRIIVIYPVGTVVELSNGDTAMVQGTPANYPLRPTVRILRSGDRSRNGMIINLLNELSLVIKEVKYIV